MSSGSIAWVEEMRAESLAKLSLTRRKDLQILSLSRSPGHPSYDFLVRIRGVNGTITPEFGVAVRGTTESLDRVRLPSAHLPGRGDTPGDGSIYHEEEGLPVCLFIFNIDTESGVYTWLREPQDLGLGTVDGSLAQDRPVAGMVRESPLTRHGLKALDQAAIDGIVQDVVRAYGYDVPSYPSSDTDGPGPSHG